MLNVIEDLQAERATILKNKSPEKEEQQIKRLSEVEPEPLPEENKAEDESKQEKPPKLKKKLSIS